MKPILVFFTLFLGIFLCKAQETLRISTEEDSIFTPPQYVNDFGTDYMEKVPVQKACKIGLTQFNKDYGISYSKIIFGYEYKLNTLFSINSGIEVHDINPYPFTSSDFSNNNRTQFDASFIHFYIEPRWYFNNKRKQINNLNGNYISFKGIFEGNDLGNRWITMVNIGAQRQTIQNTYGSFYNRLIPVFYDMNIGVGLELRHGKAPKPTFQYQLIFGSLMSKFFGKNTSKEVLPSARDLRNWTNSSWYYKTKNENIHRYFKDKKQIIKLDLGNVLSFVNSKGNVSDLGLVYERKIGTSFSLNAEASAQLGTLRNVENGYLKKNTWKLALEPRYYYKSKKGIELSENGNFLSGVYISTQLGYINQESLEQLTPVVKEIFIQKKYLFAHAIWGFQSFLTKTIFVDTRFGLGIKTPKTDTLNFFEKGEFSYLLGEIKIGFAF